MIKNFEETLATNRLATESLNTKLGEVHLELKEEKQRALLQLQWKVMSDKPEEEQEVNSKKEYLISPRRNPVVRRRGQHSLRRPEHDEKDSPLVGATQTPVSTLLKKASENLNSPSIMNLSKHRKKDPRKRISLPLLIALISSIITTTDASPSPPTTIATAPVVPHRRSYPSDCHLLLHILLCDGGSHWHC